MEHFPLYISRPPPAPALPDMEPHLEPDVEGGSPRAFPENRESNSEFVFLATEPALD